jgi:23S rRNA G2069 N7-methylase RlmK/C1962 C5-methylase RlmI
MVEIARNELKVEAKNIVIDDVLQFTDKLVKKGEQFDLILFDIY